MKKILIILSVLLMFITLTSPLFCLETLADGTITDLTGTKWQFNDELEFPTGYKIYAINATVYNNIFDITINRVKMNDQFKLHLYNQDGTRSFIYNWNWIYQTSSGQYTTTQTPTIEITGGAGATNTNFIEWLQDNATQIIDGYDVTFNSMGGLSVDPIENVTGIFLTDEDGDYLSEYIPVRSGYKFGGWYTDTSYTNKITEIFILTSDITLYAKWEPIYIYFDMRGGEWAGEYSEPGIGIYQYYGGTLDLVDEEGNYQTGFTPYKEGWIFQGWYTDDEFSIPVLYVNIDDDLNLYAKWTKEILVQLNLKTVPAYSLPVPGIDEESVTYISGSSSVVRYIISETEETSYIHFYAVSAGAVEISFNDYYYGHEYSVVIYVSEYGTTMNYYKTIYIGSKYEITSGLSNVDLSSMTYVGGDDTYCYVSSPYAGIPLNDEGTPEGDYIYFYGLKKGYCIINFNGKNGYPPVTFYLTILGTGEITLEASQSEMDLYIPPIAEQRGWDNLKKQLEDGFYENFINLDAFEIPGELNGFITNFNTWVNPLYTNGFVVAALTLVGIIAFAAYLVTAKTRG